MKRVITLILAFVLMAGAIGCSASDYKKALQLFEEQKYEEAQIVFESLGDYEDSAEMAKQCRYQQAKNLLSQKQYEKAQTEFEQLGDYEDSLALLKECIYQRALLLYLSNDYASASDLFQSLADYNEATKYALNCYLRTAKIGETILFGTYEQDADPTNGKEPIEWLVLSKEENRMLVISLYGLDSRQFDNREIKDQLVYWANSQMREYLNGEFFSESFSSTEKEQVLTTANKNLFYDYIDYDFSSDYVEAYVKHIKYLNDFEEESEDAVFLLSAEEVEALFPSTDSRKAYPTAQAIKTRAQLYDEKDYYTRILESKEGYCSWWLRSTMGVVDKYSWNSQEAFVVTDEGKVEESGWYTSISYNMKCTSICIRPAMWIDISKIS